ncbi:Putative folate-biopterin transporter 2 [Durusdinium trenchii]|uniref:Folate-biopterin transporter 2 n=2 Tax=Durusdinium trenchii TaxID=1381693 RepID=A0ABP0MU11_9DINO
MTPFSRSQSALELVQKSVLPTLVAEPRPSGAPAFAIGRLAPSAPPGAIPGPLRCPRCFALVAATTTILFCCLTNLAILVLCICSSAPRAPVKAANFAPVKAPEYTTLEVIDLHFIFLNQTLTIDISLNLQDHPIQDTFTYRDFARDLFTMAQPLLGIPLAEFRRDVPPGWAPNLPDYSLKSYFDKLRLWYRLYQGPDEQVGPLLAGRLQGRAQKIAMGLKLVRPDGTYDVGDSALVRLSTDEVRDPMDPNVILQHAIPSGVQALANALRETFGQSDQELATHSLEQFFLFKRGKLSMHEYASEWELRYESAQRHSGLEINDVAKSFLFFQSSGLPNKFIEDVKIQIQGDMSRFEEAKRLTLRLSNRSDQHALSQDLYTDQAAEFFSTPSSSWNTMDYDTYYDDWSWQDDPYWQAYPEVDPWTGYAEDEWWQEDDSWSPTASEWHTPEEYVIHDDQHETEQAAEAPETYYEDEDYYQQKSGCHVCGSRWHLAAQCPVRDKGKGGYGGGKSSWRPKGKGKGKGKKGKGKSKSFKGKGKFKGGNKGYFNDIDYSAQRSQPEQGLSLSPPASSSFTTEVKPIHMTPPRTGELLPWQEKKVTFAEDQEDEEAPAPSEPVRKQLAFATHLHASSEVYHMVKGIKRRGLLIDPGAAAGLVGSETLRDLLASCYQDKQKAVTWSASDATITGISGQPDKALGRVHLKLPFKNMEATYTADVIGKEGSRCPALVGNPAVCAMYASLHSRWFTNDDGLLVAWDTSKSEHPQMNLFRVLLTDSGHYLLPLDEDAGICDQQPEAFHFIKHLSDVSHRAWPDHAYTFWQNVTAQGPERQWSTHGTQVRSLQDDHPLTSLMSEQNKNHDIDTSCSTSLIKDHDTSTLPITSSTSDITSTGGVEAADKDYQEKKDSVVTSQLMATNLSELPLYVDDSVPPHLSQEDQQKLKKDYKAMPEEFYHKDGLT